MTDTFLTVEQAADILGVHHTSVYRWVAEGRIPAFKPTRKIIRVNSADLDAFIASCTSASFTDQSASFAASFPTATPATPANILARQRPGPKVKRA